MVYWVPRNKEKKGKRGKMIEVIINNKTKKKVRHKMGAYQ